jgi:aspartate racemase
MPAHIGIVACSPEGAALCFRTICQEGEKYLGAYGYPEVSMHAHSFADYMQCIEADDWEGVGDLMLSSASNLARSGANFLICPDNTIHRSLPLIESRSPLPWMHIAHVVGNEALERGYRRVGLLGTRWLIQSEVYPNALAARGLSYMRPEDAEREEINRIIMCELVKGVFTPEAIAYHQRVIAQMKERGCDSVVLGCTEIPLIVNDGNSPLPTLDSTRLLARTALHRAVRGAAAGE